MGRATVIFMAAALISNCAVAAEEYDVKTYEGARLELVYKAEAGEITYDNLESLEPPLRDSLLNSIRVVRLRGSTILGKGFYIISPSGEVEKYLSVSEYRDVIVPSEEGDYYFLCRGPCPTAFGFANFPKTKELYNRNGELIWSYEILGYVDAADDLSLIAVFPGRLGKITTITKEGETYVNEIGYYHCPHGVSRDGKRVIIGPSDNGQRNLRILNKKARLLLNKNVGLCGNFGSVCNAGNNIYASGKYIVISCRNETATGYYVQVYKTNGKLLWGKSYDEVSGNLDFIVSGDGNHILVYYKKEDNAWCEILDFHTGDIVQVVPTPSEQHVVFYTGAISAEASRYGIILTRFAGAPGSRTGVSKALIFDGGIKIAEFEKTFNFYNAASSPYYIQFTSGGEFAIITADTGFRVFRIHTSR
jgi:hypothetical protein